MIWGLKQGLLGSAQHSLSPSLSALGPNRYLRERDFLKMLGIAFAIHVLMFGIMRLWPQEKVTDIPVRALSFKIGDTDRIAAYAPVAAPLPASVPVAPPAAPVVQAAPASQNNWRATPHPQVKPVVKPAPSYYKPTPVKPAKMVPLEQPVAMPAELPEPAPVIITPPAPVSLPDPTILTQQAIAPNPQRFIREVGTPTGAIGGQGSATTVTESTAEQVRTRYTQKISEWVQRHLVSIGGLAGRTVVRVRIERSGYVRYFAVEESSGSDVLDRAALDMIHRANPMPAVPTDYPAGNLVEFLIPITFGG